MPAEAADAEDEGCVGIGGERIGKKNRCHDWLANTIFLSKNHQTRERTTNAGFSRRKSALRFTKTKEHRFVNCNEVRATTESENTVNR
jgi:hypothetical protein